MQEGCTPTRATVVKRRGPLRGVENELDLAVFDGVDNMRAPFRHLVDLDRGDTLFGEVALRSRCRQHPKSQSGEQAGGLDNAGLVGILDRHEDRPRLWQARAAAELALDESD